MGPADRAVRAAVLAVSSPLSWVLGAVALILIGTSLVGTRPAYLPFGFSTREAAREPDA